jgi:hypothetical protein
MAEAAAAGPGLVTRHILHSENMRRDKAVPSLVR